MAPVSGSPGIENTGSKEHGFESHRVQRCNVFLHFLLSLSKLCVYAADVFPMLNTSRRRAFSERAWVVSFTDFLLYPNVC